MWLLALLKSSSVAGCVGAGVFTVIGFLMTKIARDGDNIVDEFIHCRDGEIGRGRREGRPENRGLDDRSLRDRGRSSFSVVYFQVGRNFCSLTVH